MRVISGRARGVRLATLQGQDVTRPTTDRVKEAVFGSIQFDLEDARVLDLFAGSGALGVEALSRGAKEAVFIDQNREAVGCIEKNLAATKLRDRATVKNMGFLQGIAACSGQFDFVFLDPPYKAGLYQQAVDALLQYDRLAEGAIVIVEHDGSAKICGLDIQKMKKYGRIVVSFYQKGERGG